MNDSKLSLLPTLLAVGGGIAAAPASAIELGEVDIQSAIGQPLRASIAYALGQNEQLASYCVTLNPARAADGLPAVTRADISVANGIIALTGTSAIREPLMTLSVRIKCPYTPTVSREYMLFFDPALPQAESVIQPPVARNSGDSRRRAVSRAPSVAQRQPAPLPQAQTAPRQKAAVSAPVDPSARYRVQRGDTLSEIAARIENRPVGLWNAVTQIFDANPDAFLDDNPDKLKAGSWLVIPEFGAGKSFSVSAPASASPSAEVTAKVGNPVVDDAIVEKPAADKAVAETEAAVAAVVETSVVDNAPAGAMDSAVDDTEVLQPATQSLQSGVQGATDDLDAENPFVTSEAPAVVIPDTQLEAPTTAKSPNVPTASISVPAPQPPAQSSSGWLLWLVGGGVVLIAGLLLFGRRNRKFGGPEPFAPDLQHQAHTADDDVADKDYAAAENQLHDDAPTEENLTLDADLDVGTGLRDTGMHVYEDFGFATETNLDIELPEDEDYDMSVNVDATKISAPDDATKRDLKAIQVDATMNNEATDAYTIDQEIDYQILEQDYQNELTATQALNVEIEKAAAEIAKSMDQSEIDELTSELHLATVSELDATAKLTLDFDPVADGDADPTEEITAANEELTLEEMVADDFTVEMPRDEDTVQMPRKSNTK